MKQGVTRVSFIKLMTSEKQVHGSCQVGDLSWQASMIGARQFRYSALTFGYVSTIEMVCSTFSRTDAPSS